MSHFPQDATHLNGELDDTSLGDADAEQSFGSMDADSPPVESTDDLNGEEVVGHDQSWSDEDVSGMYFDHIFDDNNLTMDIDYDDLFADNEGGQGMYHGDGLFANGTGHHHVQDDEYHESAEEHSPLNFQLDHPFYNLPDSQPSSIHGSQPNNVYSSFFSDLRNDYSNDPVNSHVNDEPNQPIQQLSEQLNDLSIDHFGDDESENDSSEPSSFVASDEGIDEYGYELVRWFKPSLVRGIPPNQLLVYNPSKQISHVRKLKPTDFPSLTEGNTWVDEGTMVVSIEGLDEGEAGPAVWGAHFGHLSRFNILGPVRSSLPQSKKFACIYALRKALDIIYRDFYLVEPAFHTVIIRNSSPWLTRAMTGSLELYNFGIHLPWLQGHPLLYTEYLDSLLDNIQGMVNSESTPLKFRFWCVEPRVNIEAMELARLASNTFTNGR